ncbi:hypothetical protein GCM10020295_49030 [Streptomyces cinereospinus]
MSTPDALVIKVVKGTASPAELAALTSVLLSRAAALAALGPGLRDRAPHPHGELAPPGTRPGAPRPAGWRIAGSRAA